MASFWGVWWKEGNNEEVVWKEKSDDKRLLFSAGSFTENETKKQKHYFPLSLFFLFFCFCKIERGLKWAGTTK